MQSADEPSEDSQEGLGGAPAEILELAENCRAFVLRAIGVELDYTAETLPVLDQYVQTVRAGIGERPELEPLLLRAMGAYFGEVVRRTLDGFWRDSSSDVHRWQVCARWAELAVNPAGLVHEAIARESDLPGPLAALRIARQDELAVHERLARLPPVDEDEYYLLSTRLEVLEIIYASLREEMRARGEVEVELEADDYAD